LNRHVLPEANRIVGAKAYSYEQDFGTKVSQLGAELRKRSDWQRVFTKAERTALALKFLMEKADGYRLPKLLAEEVSAAAVRPIDAPFFEPQSEQ